MSDVKMKSLPVACSDLNAAIGAPHGIAPAETVMISALNHQFRTGMLRTLFADIAMLTHGDEPISDKKQLLLFVMTENEVDDTLLWLYKYIQETETGVAHDVNDISAIDMAEYMGEYFGESPYSFKFARISPLDYTMEEFFTYIEGLKEEYDIRGIFFDTPEHLKSPESDKSLPHSEQVRNKIRSLRTYCRENEASLVFTHGLSQEALDVRRGMVDVGKGKEFVKEIANKGYFNGFRGLSQEVDISLLLSIDRTEDESVLSIQVEKQRNHDRKDHDGYVEKKFQPIGTIGWN